MRRSTVLHGRCGRCAGRYRAPAAPVTIGPDRRSTSLVYLITVGAGRRDQLSRRQALRRLGAPGAAGRGRRLVAARHRDVPAREHPPHRVQHARALLARHDRRALGRDAALPARLLRLGPRRLGRGALVSSPFAVTVGASGAIFGLIGALLILEYLQTGSLVGQAMVLIVINLALTFAVPNISIGGPPRRARRRHRRDVRPGADPVHAPQVSRAGDRRRRRRGERRRCRRARAQLRLKRLQDAAEHRGSSSRRSRRR